MSLITLGVDNLRRAGDFYEALGWQRSSASVEDEVIFMRGSNVVLGLFGRDDLARDANVEFDSDASSSGIALAMNLEDERSVDAVLRAAANAGAHIVKPAQRTDWGGYSGYFSDPDGHLWEVAHNPLFALLADGRIVLPNGE